MDAVTFIERAYTGAHRTMHASRTKEFIAVSAYARAYGFEITAADFDTALANRFGGGVELEWPRD